METFRPYAELGARIKRARKARAFSQEEFAPLVGVTRRHLIRLENGEHQVGPPLAERIAMATGVSASEFRLDGEAARSGDPFHGSNGTASGDSRKQRRRRSGEQDEVAA